MPVEQGSMEVFFRSHSEVHFSECVDFGRADVPSTLWDALSPVQGQALLCPNLDWTVSGRTTPTKRARLVCSAVFETAKTLGLNLGISELSDVDVFRPLANVL